MMLNLFIIDKRADDKTIVVNTRLISNFVVTFNRQTVYWRTDLLVLEHIFTIKSWKT